MEKCTGLRIPWRMLKEKLVAIDKETGKAIYGTTFHDHVPGPKISKVTVVETLYRNKTNLESIFRIIDKDNSGIPVVLVVCRLFIFLNMEIFFLTRLHNTR